MGQLRVLRALLLECLKKQTGISGIIFNQEKCFNRFLAHSPCLFYDHMALFCQKSSDPPRETPRRVELPGLVWATAPLEPAVFSQIRILLARIEIINFSPHFA